jgi:GNAT superfamily N-acetyltransferase
MAVDDDSLDLARVLEGNEAAAYCSLIEAGAAIHGSAAFRHATVAGATALIAPPAGCPGVFNRVLGLGLHAALDDGALDAVLALYTLDLGSPALELVPAVRSESVKAALRQRRLRAGAHAAVLWREPARFDPVEGAPLAERVDGDDLATVARICAEVFGVRDIVRDVLHTAGRQPGWRAWLVHIDGTPAAAAFSRVADGRCWLGWDATLPAFRGRGAKTALDRARVDDAHRSGCTLISTETDVDTPERRSPSFRSFQRLGFRTAYVRASCLPGTEAVRP